MAARSPPHGQISRAGGTNIQAAIATSADAFDPVREGLAGRKLAEIIAAIGLSTSMASQIRSGRIVPHARLWPALSVLAEISSSRQ